MASTSRRWRQPGGISMAELKHGALAAAPRTGLTSAYWTDDEPVCPLPDWQARGLPRFGDGRWDLRGHPAAIDKVAEGDWTYDWTVVSNPAHALALREFAMGRMNRPLQLPGVTRFVWAPSTTLTCVRTLEPFFTWLEAQLPDTPLGAIAQEDLNGYAKTVLTGRGAGRSKTARLRAVQVFFAYFTIAATSEHAGDHLPLSLVTNLLPWGGRSVSNLVGRSRFDQNRTPRIPPAVMDPLLRWALFYLEVAATDILAAHRELQSYPCDAAYRYGTDDYTDRLDRFFEHRPVPLHPNGKAANTRIASAARVPKHSLNAPPTRRRLDAARHDHGTETVERCSGREDLLASVRQFVADRRQSGRGIPVYDVAEGRRSTGDVNVVLSLAMCGHYPAEDVLGYRQAASLLDAAHAQQGGEPGGMNTPISINPETGQPWRERFSPASLATETRMLQTAALLATTFLSGMRVDEVLALRPGCCRQEVSADGLIYLYRLQSTLSKGRSQPTAATWVVTEHVHRAVEILEQLPRLPARTGDGHLSVRARRRADRLFQFRSNLTHEIGVFVSHLNELEGGPLLDARGNPRALRRTLAWYIAHRPFGTTALAIQYKHVHATITEGYVGLADDEFRDLLATEAVEAELQALAQRLLARRNGIGIVRAPEPSRTSQRLDELARDTTRFPGLVDPDGHYERRLLRDEHLTYHVGGCANCAFDPAFSLCNPGGNHPIMAHCRWWECRCAEHLPEHLAAVDHAIAEARRHVRLQRLPPPQRQALRSQIKAMEAKREALVECTDGP
jgi:integrase